MPLRVILFALLFWSGASVRAQDSGLEIGSRLDFSWTGPWSRRPGEQPGLNFAGPLPGRSSW